MLTPEQQAKRADKIGASFIPALMAGDEKKIAREWMRLVGHPSYVPEDLSDQWGPSFGSFIEPFVLDWHEKKTGHPITDRGEWVLYPGPEYPYLGCTLDGYRCHDNTCIDAKQWSRWSKIEECLETYPGQMVVQKACTRAERAALLVCHGGEEPTEHELRWLEEYEAEVWSRIRWFWNLVETLQAPCALPGVKAALVNAVRVVDMGKSNAWADFAATWLKNAEAKKAFDGAAKGLKELIEPDVARAFGHGICATRSKTGAVTIKEQC
jgi:hypothetical protein